MYFAYRNAGLETTALNIYMAPNMTQQSGIAGQTNCLKTSQQIQAATQLSPADLSAGQFEGTFGIWDLLVFFI